MNSYTMRQARACIEDAILNPLPNGQNRVIYLEGDPGIGKTAMAHSLYWQYRRYKNPTLTGAALKAKDNIHYPGGFTHFIPFIAPEREPTDWGLPMPNESKTAIRMLPLQDFLFGPDDCPFIFLDEIDKANNMMQNVLGRVMHEQRVGEIVFPVRSEGRLGTFVLAAGNKMTNRAGSMTANTHIKNRRTHLPVHADTKEYLEDVGIPWDIHSSVISYLRTAPDMLHKFDAGAPSFPSPRSWTKVGLSLNVKRDGKSGSEVERMLIEGDIGVEASNTFYGHLQIFRGIRSLEEITANPSKVPLPTGRDAVAIMYAEITSLAKHTTPANAEAVFTYFNRLPGEYTFVGYRDVMLRDKSILPRSKTGQVWWTKNADLVQATRG